MGKAERRKLVSCNECRGYCCDGMALQIETPRTREDYENIRWYLYHDKTHVYIDGDGDWIAEIDLPCRHRDPRGGRCKIYGERRPPVCREAKIEECEMNFNDAVVRFRTVEEYDAWLRKKRSKRRSEV